MSTMSQKIYNRRKELGMTMEELAEKVGVTKSTINKWEKDDIKNMKRTSIEGLAKALDCDVLWLMGIEIEQDKVMSLAREAERNGRLLEYARLLSPQHIEELIRYAEYLKSKQD